MDVRPRVLLVDDDEALLESAGAVLEDSFEVLTASNARDALALLSSTDVDVVCADYDMPSMSGTELLHRVAQTNPTMGRLLVTAMTDQFEERGSSSNGYGILLKPYDPKRLEWLLKQQVRIRSMRRAVDSMVSRVDTRQEPSG